MALGICAGCRRFARGARCPFCGARVGAPAPLPLGRRTRAGRLVGPATALVILGCGSAEYGAPPFDSGPDDGKPVAADAAYGGLPYDSGVDSGTDSGPSDAGDGG